MKLSSISHSPAVYMQSLGRALRPTGYVTLKRRDPYGLFRDGPCRSETFKAMNFRKFLSYCDAGTVSSLNVETRDDHVELAEMAVAAGIVFG